MNQTRSAVRRQRSAPIVSRRIVPPADHPDAKLRTCRECGERFLDWRHEDARPCVPCSIARAKAAQISMAARCGPFYEQAVLKQLEFWLGEAERLGIRATQAPPTPG